MVLHACCTWRCVQVCPTLREQMTAAQHKNTKLTAARDKLEIILHDMEAAALKEQQQLAAANKALRSTGQQLTATKQQLTRTQQELAAAQQQLAEAEVRQAANAQAVVVQPQVVTAAGQRQLQETAATTGSEAATPPAVGAQAQVGGRQWLQAQGGVLGPSPKTPLYWRSRLYAPLCLQPSCLCL